MINSKSTLLKVSAAFLLASSTCAFAENPRARTNVNPAFKRFTGRVVGKNVRLRTGPDIESAIVKEIPKGELYVVVGERNDFYMVTPPSNLKAYLFRSFVLDNVVEGNRVNVRLEPELEAPVINHVSSGTRIDGKISDKNNKWLEISPPADTTFYVAKEFVEYVGGEEYKAAYDKRYATLNQLLESSALMTQSELRKPFEEMDISRIARNYQSIIDDYQDFESDVATAKQLLSNLQETYLQRKIAFLEAKASRISLAGAQNRAHESTQSYEPKSHESSTTGRMMIWEPIEEALYRSWAALHRASTIDDYYIDQKLNSQSLIGILEAYSEPVKNKPGDYILKENGRPVAYLYSTQIDLENLIGKRVNLSVTERPNNNFAFPAFYVLDAE